MSVVTVIDQPKRKLDLASILENVTISAIVFAVIAAALANSFTHMHDWTVRAFVAAAGLDRADASPYGWCNAVISELIPLAGLLALRRRIVAGQSVASYALGLVIVGTGISILAQVAWVSGRADGKVSAGFLAVLPAVAAGAMIKLALSILDSYRQAAEAEADAEGKYRAEVANFRAAIDQAEAEAARAAEAEAAALAEAEAARNRERNLRAEAEEEARNRRQAAAIAEADATRLEDEVGAEADARRDAERAAARLEAELAQIRAAHAKATEDLAVAQELLELERPAATVTKLRPSGGVHREPITVPGDLPRVPGVGSQLAARIAETLRERPALTQKEVAQLLGTSDRSVRAVVAALANAA